MTQPSGPSSGPVSAEQFDQWLAAARAGNGQAMGLALESLRGLLRKLGMRHLSPSLRIKARVSDSDLIQETYRSALETFAAFRGKSRPQFISWISSILVHRCHDLERRYLDASKRSGDEIQISANSWCEEFLAQLPDKTPAPDARLRTYEWYEALERAISRLDGQDQVCVRWLLADETTLAALAALLDLSLRTVRDMVQQARGRLAEHFLSELRLAKAEVP